MPTPNLFLATQKLFKPHRWFSSSNKISEEKARVEHRDHPVPGTYEYRPGRGWYLIATDDCAEKLSKPIHVKYSRVLRRNLLQPEYDARKSQGQIRDEEGVVQELGFFQLDDGIGWVNYLDEEGSFIPGPYKIWCIDRKTGEFRPMLKSDDPAWQSRHSSHSSRRTSSATKSDRMSEENDSLFGPQTSSRSRLESGQFNISAPSSRPGSLRWHHTPTHALPSTPTCAAQNMNPGVSGSDSTATTAPTSPCSSTTSYTLVESIRHQRMYTTIPSS